MWINIKCIANNPVNNVNFRQWPNHMWIVKRKENQKQKLCALVRCMWWADIDWQKKKKNKMKMQQNEFYGNWRFAYLRWKLCDRQGEPVMSHALVDYAMHESVRTNRYWTFANWAKVKLTIDHHNNNTSTGQFITQRSTMFSISFRLLRACVRIQSLVSHRKNSVFDWKAENFRFLIWSLLWIQWLMQITHRNGSPVSLLYLCLHTHSIKMTTDSVETGHTKLFAQFRSVHYTLVASLCYRCRCAQNHNACPRTHINKYSK